MADTAADLRVSSAGQACTYSLLAKAFHEGFLYRDPIMDPMWLNSDLHVHH